MSERTIYDHSDPKGERIIRREGVDVISQRRYDELRPHKYAGPLSSLMPETAERFGAAGATHWHLSHTSHGTVLAGCVIKAEDGAS